MKNASRRVRSPFRSFAVAAGLLLSLPLAAQKVPTNYHHFKWENPAEGVWVGISTDNSFIGANTMIVSLQGHGTLVVDAHITEATANEIIAKAKEVGGGPVRYLINSHFHNDRTGGNFAFKKAFPDIQIIAHENSCWAEKEKAEPRWEWRIGELPKDIADINANIAKVSDPKIKDALQHINEGNELYLNDGKTFDYAYPNVCLDLKPGEKLMFRQGTPDIEIYFLGGAHTAGDLQVYMPQKKILFEGDLWSDSGNFMCDGRDGSLLQCPSTLARVRALDVALTIPGNGEPFQGKKGLEEAIAKASAFDKQVMAAWVKGEYVDQAIAEIKAPAPYSGPPRVSDYVPYMNYEKRYGENASFHRAIIRAFEEIEFDKQHNLPLPEIEPKP
jgi:glyoxylase-like metal-dependent hydrolase (beta-lactamase superfamily II)